MSGTNGIADDREVSTFIMGIIHDRWSNGTKEDRDLIWSLQDGYGIPGYMPAQGYDWSGVRDSSDQTLLRIYDALSGVS